jgi:hypothetical protein
MRRLTPAVAVPLLLALLSGSGCGPDGSGSLGRVPTAGPSASPASPPASPAGPDLAGPSSGGSAAAGRASAGPAEPARAITIEVWFTRGGKLFPTRRTRPATVATSRLALTELVAGPTVAEAAAGVRSQLPTELPFDVSIAGGVATVDLPEPFYSAGRGGLPEAQVVYTLTQFPTVSAVRFRLAGEPVAGPAGRADHEQLLPLIVVTDPVIGQRVTSPVTVSGTANVFEATVSIRILDAGGDPLATTFTTATCGSGCRGDYSTAVGFRVGSQQRGTVQVYQVSPADGSRTHVVDIPVTLVPDR